MSQHACGVLGGRAQVVRVGDKHLDGLCHLSRLCFVFLGCSFFQLTDPELTLL